MDFKTQLMKDLAVFHNPGEFATMTNIWYGGANYTIPVVIDHEETLGHRQLKDDHAEGINRTQATLYIAFNDLGFVPEKGCTIELEEAGAIKLYEITKSDYEDGEIILELEAFDE